MKLDWSNQPRKTKIVTGAGIVSLEFKTTESGTYKGYFGAAADSSSGHLVRRMWFSRQPGGEPIKAMYKTPKGIRKNAATASGGGEFKLNWTQGEPVNKTQVPLKPNSVYYLNISQVSRDGGQEPTRLAAMFLSASTSGEP